MWQNNLSVNSGLYKLCLFWSNDELFQYTCMTVTVLVHQQLYFIVVVPVGNIKSKFLTDIIEAWAKFNYKEFNVEKESVSKQILWNNSYIKNKNEILFYKEWHDKGVTLIEHVYDYRIKTFLSFAPYLKIREIVLIAISSSFRFKR